MITFDDAMDCVRSIAAKYLVVPYEELRLRRQQAEQGDVDFSCNVSSPRGDVWVDAVFGEYGRIWKRVSVELTAVPRGDQKWPRPPCVYMERFANGKAIVWGMPEEGGA